MYSSPLKYFAVKVDIKSLASDPDNPGHSLAYRDFDINPPELLEPGYDTMTEAVTAVTALMNNGRGEEVEVTLANGSQYKGPRYFYYTANG